MAVIASLVVGSNGATTLEGGSRGLSTPADRDRFIARHRQAGAFIIGKNSAVAESYRSSSVPIFVFTRKFELLTLPDPHMQQINVSPASDLGEITRRIDQRIQGDIVVEAGAQLLIALIEAGVIDLLELSISPIEGDGNYIKVSELLAHFSIVSSREIDGTTLMECSNESDATHS